MEIHIEPYKTEMAEETSGILAHAFMSNPLHIAAFGKDLFPRNKLFFLNALHLLKGTKYVAHYEKRIIGFIHWVDSEKCQFTIKEKLLFVPLAIKDLGPSAALRLGIWLSIWEKHDLEESHLHLGPIGVDPLYKGKGIGKLLMEQYCKVLDNTAKVGYLETDLPENVRFYKYFGFEIVKEIQILKVQNYLMTRA
jgi:GNAT superfamily N-acetyltransferase